MQTKTSTIDTAEIERFSRLADQWWDEDGKFAPLHRINPLRIGYIRDRIQDSGFRIQDISLLDIGCGGGLIAEPMARLGARVTAIDASEKNIAVARAHAEKGGLAIDYRCSSAEALAASGAQFNVVLALEIVEHVADVDAFVAATSALVKPGGLLIMSTLNRTAKSYALAIISAEYILRWVPAGTHTWSKFLRPSELCKTMEKHGIEIAEMTGMALNPLTWKWELRADDLSVNYLVVGKK